MKRSSLRALLAYLGSNWPAYALAVALTIGDKLLDSLGFTLIVTSIANGAIARNATLVMQSAAWLAALGFGRSVLLAAARYTTAVAAEGAARRLRQRLMAAWLGAVELPGESAQSGRVVASLVNDVEAVKLGYAGLLNATGQAFVVVTVLVALTLWQWQVAVTTAALALISLLSAGGFAAPLKRLGAAYQMRLAAVTELATSLMSGLPVIKSLRAEQALLARFRATTTAHFAVGQQRGTMSAYQSLAANGVPWLALAGLVAVNGALALKGALSVGQALGLVQLGTRALFPLAILGSAWAGLQANLAAVDRVGEALAVTQEEPAAARELERVADQLAGAPGLSFDDVSFSYGDRPVLHGTTFAVPAGGRLALGGPSGSGKTTIIKLILGFCRPAAGAISIAGHRTAGLSPSALRRLTSYVPQESWLFPGTVRENLALANTGATDAEIIAAARAANAHEFIERLPQGYETVLDERGSNLSGGERQRLCLARALLKDAPVLLLDEATAAVDAESERLIRRAVDALGTSRTVVTVAHTAEMTRAADVTVTLA